MKMMDPPMSPYINTTYACIEGTKENNYTIDRLVFSQNDFIPHYGGPFSWAHMVFKMPYKLPPFAEKLYTECRGPPDRQVCTDAYHIMVKFAMLDLGCPMGPTAMVTYNGTYPGPTMLPLAGRQSMIRVTNKLYEGLMTGDPSFAPLHPCNEEHNRVSDILLLSSFSLNDDLLVTSGANTDIKYFAITGFPILPPPPWWLHPGSLRWLG
jgi:hypothetical protein